MNIAIVVRRLNVHGGIQRVVAYLAHTLRAQGHSVKLYTFFYDRDVCFPKLLEDFEIVEADARVVAPMKETSCKRGILSFFKNYYNENRAAQNLASKISKDIDILNPHDPLSTRVAHYYKKDNRKIPSVWVCHDMSTKKASFRRNSEFNQTIRASIFRKLFYWLIDTYEYQTFVEDQDIIALLDTRDKKWADEEFPRSTTAIIRNGLDIKEFPYHARTSITGKRINLFAIALLLPHRRFEDAVEAVSLLQKKGYDIHFTIAGDPADKKYYAKLLGLVSTLQLGTNVSFLGKISPEALLSAYQTADIFIFPCHLQSWGLAVFEAMASGLPVIVSETAGASEVLVDEKTAMIVPPYSPEKIAEAVEKLATDPIMYRSISVDGRKFVEENITWEKYTQSLLDLFARARGVDTSQT